MNKTNYLLFAALTVAALFTTTLTRADQPNLSPRTRTNQTTVAPASAAQDPNLLAQRPAGNARGWAVLQSVRTIPSTGPGIDLAHARPTLSPKDPHFEMAQRALATQQFQIAPVK